MRGLITEGVLIELSDGRIAFGYQRLGDVTRATVIAENSADDVQTWLGNRRRVWRERGVLSALAVIVPERHGVELLDLAANEEGRVSYEVVDSFLRGLLLRSPDRYRRGRSRSCDGCSTTVPRRPDLGPADPDRVRPRPSAQC